MNEVSISNRWIDYDCIVYSSHKTGTQSLVATLCKAGYPTMFMHHLQDQIITFNDPNCDTSAATFSYLLQDYLNTRGKKMKIITVRRDPFDRTMSSFFETYHTIEIWFGNVKDVMHTTIMRNDLHTLMDLYLQQITTAQLPGLYESLFEMSETFKVDVISQLEEREQGVRYASFDTFELFCLDFDRLFDASFLTRALDMPGIDDIFAVNLTMDTIYSEKFCQFREMLRPQEHQVVSILKSHYPASHHAFFFHVDATV